VALDAIVIGTGFGGTIAAVQLAAKGKSVLLLERGTFWRSPDPLSLRGDKFGPWAEQNKMPVQYWPRPDHRKGLLDFVAAMRRTGNKDGLYQYSQFHQADVLTANGVGGGSLIYSNVTIASKREVLDALNLNLTDADFDAARAWMEGAPGDRKNANRGWLNYIVTKVPMGKISSQTQFWRSTTGMPTASTSNCRQAVQSNRATADILCGELYPREPRRRSEEIPGSSSLRSGS
jgi:monoamine oxidase